MSLAANAGSMVGLRGSLTPTGRRVVNRKIDDSGNESSRNGRDGGEGVATLQHVSQLQGDCRAEFAGFKQMIRGQSELIRTQQETIQDLKEAVEEQRSLIRDLKVALEDTKQRMCLELKRLSDKLEAITARPSVTPPRSFAEVAGSQRPSQPANVTPSKTAAALSPVRSTARSTRVEEANKDHVQVSSIRQAIEGEMRAMDENKVNIAKMSWLSNKGSGKAYGSMVVYVTKESDARRLVDGHYFDLAGESATTNVFERRTGPVQCYNCQTIGHKSFQSMMSKTLRSYNSMLADDGSTQFGQQAGGLRERLTDHHGDTRAGGVVGLQDGKSFPNEGEQRKTLEAHGGGWVLTFFCVKM
ncbi:reverse transcriptase [Purpureocillium lavendulum]|uniref:Reverse transcriptase n=1 Tax=Purpureocillium lavendulum TaxID=1247861 RepID=A0AB34FCS4_9HYPO|nr:reverse transcriptase [Purpureocillium lavendulum]